METIKQRTLSAARVARYVGGFAAGFLLAGARIVGVPIPAAVCLIAATPPGAVPLLTLLGAAASCLCFWETETAVLTVAAGFLALTANWALRDTPVTRKALYAPLTATAAGAVSSILLLLSGAVSAQSMTAFVVRMITLPFGTVAVQRLREKPRGVPLCLAAAAMISGSGGIELPGGVPLGGILAGGFCLYAAAGE
ncbi:MAG: hypothetical protein IJT18_02455, partial [Oscillospiraceae bacterium]|nr:hypothetical protein [Oscillospiraceae bacterium]